MRVRRGRPVAWNSHCSGRPPFLSRGALHVHGCDRTFRLSHPGRGSDERIAAALSARGRRAGETAAEVGCMRAGLRRRIRARTEPLPPVFDPLLSTHQFSAVEIGRGDVDAAMAAAACVEAGKRCLRLFANLQAESFAKRGTRFAETLDDPEGVQLLIELTRVSIGARRPSQRARTCGMTRRPQWPSSKTASAELQACRARAPISRLRRAQSRPPRAQRTQAPAHATSHQPATPSTVFRCPPRARRRLAPFPAERSPACRHA